MWSRRPSCIWSSCHATPAGAVVPMGRTIGDSDSYVTRRRWPRLSIIGASYSAVGCSIRLIGDVEARPFKGASAFLSADPDGEF
jgi:hypothetical protein